MAKKRAIQLFRTGKHTDGAGNTHEFTAEQVSAIAAGFDPKKAPAPVVVGHPGTDAPAYGWVDGLSFNASTGRLDASLDLHDAMDEAIRAKHYNRVSAAFFGPEHPSNPNPGKFYLRHVGLLGGAAPAVPGLAPFGFADAGQTGPVLTVEFATEDGRSLLEQLVDSLSIAIGKQPPSSTSTPTTFAFNPSFTAPRAPENTTMNDADKAELERLRADNKRLTDQSAALEQKQVGDAANAFAEGLVTAKKIDPSRKNEIVATYLGLAKAGAVEFAAADGAKTTTSALDAWKKTFEAAAPVIDTKETTAPDGSRKAIKANGFSAPAGVQVDAESAELHNKTLAYMAKTGMKATEYPAALALVQAGNTA